MRILLGGLTHEANTFSPHNSDLTDFDSRQMLLGDEILENWQNTGTEQAGAMSVLSETPDCIVVPTFLARGISGGPIVADVYHHLLNKLLDSIKSALPAEGILLVLHGAMMAENEPDATGDILQRVRELVGPDVPVVGTLDLHANVTRRMVNHATALVGYMTAPHVDMYQTGQSAARVLIDCLQNRLRPTTSLVHLPMILPPENSTDLWGPLSHVINMAHEMRKAGKIVHGSVYPVQPWMDTEDMAASVLVLTNDDADAAQSCAMTIAKKFWSLRQEFAVELTPADEAVARAQERVDGTVILCDSADSTTSGSTGDSTVILTALLNAQPFEGTALLNIVDPDAVAIAIESGVGSTVRVEVGGKRAPNYSKPAAIDAYVKTISDGVFTFKGPGMQGVPHQMGRTVVLLIGGIHLVVMENAVSQWDPQLYRGVGEEPADARIVQVKSPMAFRAAYSGLYDEVFIVKSPGAANPDLAALSWKHLPRPIYPLDPHTDWP